MEVRFITEDSTIAMTREDEECLRQKLRESLVGCRFVLLQQEGTYTVYVYQGGRDLDDLAHDLMRQLHLDRSAFQGAGRLESVTDNTTPPQRYATGATFNSYSCMKSFQYDRPKDEALAATLIAEIGEIMKGIYNV